MIILTCQILLALLFIGSCLIDARAQQRLTPEQALSQLGKGAIELTMVIERGTDCLADEGVIYLVPKTDSAAPIPTLLLTSHAIAELREQGIINPVQYFSKRSVNVSADVIQLNKQLLLPIYNADQLQLS